MQSFSAEIMKLQSNNPIIHLACTCTTWGDCHVRAHPEYTVRVFLQCLQGCSRPGQSKKDVFRRVQHRRSPPTLSRIVK